jgi:hypothetical protein
MAMETGLVATITQIYLQGGRLQAAYGRKTGSFYQGQYGMHGEIDCPLFTSDRNFIGYSLKVRVNTLIPQGKIPDFLKFTTLFGVYTHPGDCATIRPVHYSSNDILCLNPAHAGLFFKPGLGSPGCWGEGESWIGLSGFYCHCWCWRVSSSTGAFANLCTKNQDRTVRTARPEVYRASALPPLRESISANDNSAFYSESGRISALYPGMDGYRNPD